MTRLEDLDKELNRMELGSQCLNLVMLAALLAFGYGMGVRVLWWYALTACMVVLVLSEAGKYRVQGFDNGRVEVVRR
jgi:fatty acid desaturase